VTLVQLFPRLATEPVSLTSPEDLDYNCIAWAAGISDQWWEPVRVLTGTYYWPEHLPRGDLSVANYIEAFRTVGFEPCADGALGVGVERIAIYAIQGIAKHAARQLPDGRWASKLGQWIDIEHQNPNSLTGSRYGEVAAFMSRPRTS
jgi:hypothetical protein